MAGHVNQAVLQNQRLLFILEFTALVPGDPSTPVSRLASLLITSTINTRTAVEAYTHLRALAGPLRLITPLVDLAHLGWCSTARVANLRTVTVVCVHTGQHLATRRADTADYDFTRGVIRRKGPARARR